MTTENKEILKQAYQKWHDSKGGSVEHWLDMMTDDIDFNSLAQGSSGLEFACQRISKENMRGYFEGLLGTFEMIHYTVNQYIGEGNTVVAIGHTSWKNKATGKVFDTPKVDVVTFKDGKICGFYEYYDTAMILKTHE